MEAWMDYLARQAEAGRTEAAALAAEGRQDDANFVKVRANIYDVCKTVSRALLNRPGAGAGAVRERLERFRNEWGEALRKARDHGDVRGIAVEETKLAALADVLAHFPEVTAP